MFAANDDPHDAAERRIEQRLADRQFAADKGLVVVRGGRADGGMVGRACLHHDATAKRPATAAARHLRDKLAGAFGGAEVGQMERRIGVDDADEHHARKVEALGDHLRADKDVDLAGTKGVERLLVAAPGSHRVGIHAGHAGAAESTADEFLQPLCAGAPLHEIGRAAFRAVGRQPSHEAAAVADAAIARLVEREGQVALRAAGGMAAGATLHMRGKAAAVE